MKDYILVTLCAIAEVEKPIECDVTLIVGGFLISGFVISSKEYLKHHHITQSLSLTIKNDFPELSEPFIEKIGYDYIHLRDAKYYLPGVAPIPTNAGVFVRISLESVNGFTFGKLESA